MKSLSSFGIQLSIHWMITSWMDFAENFSCRSLDEIQTAYWNQTSVTIHPVVAYYRKNGELCHKSLVFVSDEISHSSGTVMAFIDKLVPVLKAINNQFSHSLLDRLPIKPISQPFHFLSCRKSCSLLWPFL